MANAPTFSQQLGLQTPDYVRKDVTAANLKPILDVIEQSLTPTYELRQRALEKRLRQSKSDATANQIAKGIYTSGLSVYENNKLDQGFMDDLTNLEIAKAADVNQNALSQFNTQESNHVSDNRWGKDWELGLKKYIDDQGWKNKEWQHQLDREKVDDDFKRQQLAISRISASNSGGGGGGGGGTMSLGAAQRAMQTQMIGDAKAKYNQLKASGDPYPFANTLNWLFKDVNNQQDAAGANVSLADVADALGPMLIGKSTSDYLNTGHQKSPLAGIYNTLVGIGY